MAYEQPSGSREKSNELRDKIREWIDEESASDPKIKNINLDDLLWRDLAIAQQIHTGNITQEEWDNYTDTLKKELDGAPEDIKTNRGLFHRLAGNRANPIIGEKQLEEMKKENPQ